MTQRKHFKQLVRARMAKTGEGYAAARRQVVGQVSAPVDGAHPAHLPGSVAAATALRILLTHAGVRDPRSRAPLTEAMVYGIAGGVGIGVFTFLYEKDDFASIFLAGRHLWHDDLAYLTAALERFGIATRVRESTSAKAAEKNLRDCLELGPAIGWVDMSQLPHRAMPAEYGGGGYHVVTVYEFDGDRALIGDLTDEPIAVSAATLAGARGRIKKFKNRVLALEGAAGKVDLEGLVFGGLAACYEGLDGVGAPGSARGSFRLEALERLADRMLGATGKESWDHVFPTGKRLFRALVFMNQFIEHWGTGGGLGRPLMAEFLAEAGAALGDARLRGLSERYAALGRGWSEVACAALPEGVPLLREARALHARIAELTNSGGSSEELGAAWQALGLLETQAGRAFPLNDDEARALRGELQETVRALYAGEVEARGVLGEIVEAAKVEGERHSSNET